MLFLLFLFISTYITTTLNFAVALFAKGRIFPDPKQKNFTLYANMKNKTCCGGRFTLTSVSMRVNISSSAMRSSANLSRFEFFGFDTEFGFTRYSPRLDAVGITGGEWQQKDIEHFISVKISFNDNEYIEIILWPVV